MRKDLESSVIRCVLGCRNDEPELMQTMLELEPDDFLGCHREAFAMLKQRFISDKPIDLPSMVAEGDSKLDALFLEYAPSVLGPHNLKHYRDELMNAIRVDDYVRVGQRWKEIAESEVTLEEKLDALAAVSPRILKNNPMSARTVKDAFRDAIIDLEKDFVKGQETGFNNLDTMLHAEGNGIDLGSLVVILGGSKQGKSALATSIWLNRLNDTTCSIAYTMEITTKEFMQNCIAQVCGIDRTDIKKRRSDDENVAMRLAQFGPRIATKENAFVYDTPNMTLSFIIQTAKAHARKMPVQTILIDYLTLIKRPDSRQPDYQVYGEMVTALRQLAKELQCIVLLVSQVTKDSQKRADKRPQRTDARDTSQLIYDSHLMLGTYVDSYKLPNKPQQMEVNIILNRNGIADEKCYFNFVGGNLSPKGFEEGKKDEIAIETAKLSSPYATM